MELLHRAHLDVGQACLAQQQSDLLTLGTNLGAKTLVVVVLLKCEKTQYTARKIKNMVPFSPAHYDVTTGFHLLLVGGDDADVGNADGFVQLLGKLAAVEHDLHSLGCVEPRRVVTLPHLGGLERENDTCHQHEGSCTK